MTPREITRHIGIRPATIRSWRSAAPSDWRYKLLMVLEDEATTPKQIEDILTKKPEVTSADNTSITALLEEMQELKELIRAKS